MFSWRNIWCFFPVALIGCTQSQTATQTGSPGELLAKAKGCTACHSLVGQPGVGPTFKGLFGKMETLSDGTQIQVDETYLRESIQTPTAKIVKGFVPSMPAVPLTPEEIDSLVRLIQSLK